MRVAWPWLGVLALWTSAFAMACRLTLLPLDEGTSAPSTAARVMGSTLSAASENFYELADVYFHKGIGPARRRAFRNDVFQRLCEHISPSRHAHVAGRTLAEIMPALRFAIWADPHHIEPYLVAAFWLAGDCRRPDLAERVLIEGLQANPLSHEIRMELARLFLKTEQLPQAERAFSVALNLWPGELDAASPDALTDKVQILLYLALLHEVNGRPAEALRDLEAVMQIAPANRHVAGRIAELRRGVRPAIEPRELWRQMLLTHPAVEAQCEERQCPIHGHHH